MNGQIFISYRRQESSAWAGRLSDHLSHHFPSNQVFMDVDSVDLGEDFVKTIEKTVGSCDVLIAVIGKGWLTSSEKEGQRRLDNPDDFVRLEIATALKRNIRVIPVLVDGALMPRPGDLPDDLKALVRRNALQLSHDRFRADSQRLASAVERALEKTAPDRGEREQRERAAAEIRECQEKEQLDARRREHEEQGWLEHEPQSQPPTPIVPVASSTSSVKPESDKPSAETTKVVYPLSPKPAEPEHEKPPPPSSGGTAGKSPSKQIISFLTTAAALVVGALIYFAIRASQSPPPQPAPVAAVTPSPPITATPTVEEKAPPTPAAAVLPSAQPTAPVAAVTPSPPMTATPTVEEKALPIPEVAVLPSAQPTAPVAAVTPSPPITATPTVEEKAPPTPEVAVLPFAQPTAPVAAATPSPSISATPTKKDMARMDNATKDHPWVNSLGMKFVPVADTQVLFSVWDTRVQDFEAFVKSTGYDPRVGVYSLGKDGWKQRGATWRKPGFSQGPTHPVVGVSWNDAEEFCKWLTKRERSAGDLPQDREYRLPKDEEWSAAVGLKNEVGNTPEEKDGKIELYPWDIPKIRDKSWPPPAGAGNYAGEEAKNGDWPTDGAVIEGYNDGYPWTSPVGSFEANFNGLYDMGGNVWQWCEDWYNAKMESRVFRGASWNEHDPGNLLASYRGATPPNTRYGSYGFRCVVAVETEQPNVSAPSTPLVSVAIPTPSISVTPSLAAVASTSVEKKARRAFERATKDHPWVNSLGMKFVPVADTQVLFSVWDTRVQDFEAFVKSTGYDPRVGVYSLGKDGWKQRGATWRKPGFSQGLTHPVVGVSWNDAEEFCKWLTKRERSAGDLPQDREYRLPKDEEWSAAVGLKNEVGNTPEEKDGKIELYPWDIPKIRDKSWPPPSGAGNYC